MTYQYARIDLSKTTYQPVVENSYLPATPENFARLCEIYRKYCVYKKFTSVMPLFESQFTDTRTDIIGYYDCDELVAFSLIKLLDQSSAMCEQFAWTYHQPKLRLGITSLQTECAIYKERGFRYLYLDQAHLYKQGFEGFELLGPIT